MKRLVLRLLTLLAATTVTLAQAQTPPIDTFYLINAANSANLGLLSNSTKINLAITGKLLNIQAYVESTTRIKSVVFDMDGTDRVRVDRSTPYSLAGGIGTSYFVSTALNVLGTHTVSATAYSTSRGSGTAGKKLTVTFTVVDEKVLTSPVAPPVAPPVATPVSRPVAPPVATPVARPVAPPVTTPITLPTGSSSKCGGAVNTGGTAVGMCTRDLWDPTGTTSMHCYAYGGPSDPCAIHNNNDSGDGLHKNPSACDRGTFYLWDEPDTQGKDYVWAGTEWAKYAARFSTEITALRASGVKFTSPLLKAGGMGVLARNLDAFYAACGPGCRDPASPAYINVNAVNAFVGPWNTAGIQGCRDAATFMTSELSAYPDGLPWYITNWSRLGTSYVDDQADAMKVLNLFFAAGSRIQRIYWFGATDYGGGSSNNFLTNVTSSGLTLGQVWKANCDAL